MREPVVVINETEDGLYRKRWIFDWHHQDLMLCRYHHERLEKGEWRLLELYDREDKGGYGPWVWLKESAVPWDDELKAEAALAVVAQIKVGKRQDFGPKLTKS
jgi:hypothetical protein